MKKTKYLDDEEKLLIESFGDLSAVKAAKPSAAQQKLFKKAAKDYIESEAKMNIRIDSDELKAIKKHAASQGLKYQTFVKSILHKYITGQLIEKRSR